MKEKIYYKVIGIYFTLLVLSIIICSILFTYNVYGNDFVSGVLFIFGIIGLLLYFYYRLIFKRANIYDLLIIIMAFFGYLSYLYSYDQRVALIGFISGREGLLVIISYYIYFLLASTLKNEKVKKTIIYLFTFYGLLNAIYGILQIYDVKTFLWIPIDAKWKVPLATGFVSHSNYLGSLMVMMLGIWMPKYLFSNKLKEKVISFIILFIFLFGFIVSGAMSAVVGFIGMFILLLIYYYKKREYKSLKRYFFNSFSIIVILICSLVIIVNTTDSQFDKDLNEFGSQVSETVAGNIEGTFGNGRIHIWITILKYFYPKYLLTGVGIDNLVYIGNEVGEFVYDPITELIVYKAHNEYLQILVTEGVFKILTYCLFLAIIFIVSLVKVLKNKNIFHFSLFLMFVGYVIQAFFNISMTRVAPLFYIGMGLLVSFNDEDKFA